MIACTLAMIALTMVMMLIVGLILGIALLKLPAADRGALFPRYAQDDGAGQRAGHGLYSQRVVAFLPVHLDRRRGDYFLAVTTYQLGLMAEKNLQWLHWSGEPE